MEENLPKRKNIRITGFDLGPQHSEDRNRKSLRMKGFDYSSDGYYFITICTHNREYLFGNIVGATRGSPAHMKPNEFGEIVQSIWETLPGHHNVELDIFQLMPNHIHFIIGLSGRSRPTPTINPGGSRPAPTVGTIVGLFKSECTKQIRRLTNNTKFEIWQRNYYEHIIHTNEDFDKIRAYIQLNPEMWERDRNNPENTSFI